MAIKNDSIRVVKLVNGKTLIDHDFIAEMQTVLEQGSDTHGNGHWKDREISVYDEIDHIDKHAKSSHNWFTDSESGKSHFAHIACRAMIAWWRDQEIQDDRGWKEDK